MRGPVRVPRWSIFLLFICAVGATGVDRKVGGLRVVACDIPEGCIVGYYPECNPLLPLWHHEEKSKTPAAKSIPVSVQREAEAA